VREVGEEKERERRRKGRGEESEGNLYINSDLEIFCRAFREIGWDFHGLNGLKSILTTLSICPRSVFF
jgi:hypothetical protein